MHIANDFLSRVQIEPEVKLVVEQAGPAIRAGAYQEYEIIVRINLGEADVPSALHIDRAGIGLRQRRYPCDGPDIDRGGQISPKKIFTETNYFRRESPGVRNILLIRIIRKRYG